MSRALSLYRRLLRTARTWEGGEVERYYIRSQARLEFEAKRSLRTTIEIDNAINEGEQRLEVGLHYKNPYPRPHYSDPGTLGGEADLKRQTKRVDPKASHRAKVSKGKAFKW
ncbi:hypothetical protein SPRG_13149 [Saprolegnia parasitica CBS 223.65]|uniref:Complex 1 LYR protein domain-containing protein n=1 Tax=Saprolegnia parasitica (strain CBS 223.65) TaxID=695850 RepID=A0A067BU13_SAPPC|nr:hypothetical protein SPRG_13149 [Saprolegnia parasitica CBS 223.65]KDO21733.1 hypothetical protein SPRG_13149 [Saprolegnia parasitica CBS 223.65]|eukprot:XP_012207536.1 hypothetical protein SPRG_13149 [Saprolegnia parasitica CBS 223.65]